MTTSARPVLSARDIGKSFGAVVAAAEVTIEVPAGQRLSLIGSNGAGKTTFVNMVTGYLRPDRGAIELDGEPILGLAPRLISRKGICRSFQIPQLCVELTALQNMLVACAAADAGGLSFWRDPGAGGHQERALDLIRRFGLHGFADRLVSELPGGVRKLLDIAMALARKPRLLLLDEPTSGVSAEEKFPAMDRVMEAISGEAATVVFVEHDMDIVRAYADRVIAFYSGRVIADGTPDTVLRDAEVRRYVTGGTA
ncbi:ABC transporter ATP-binding protein [Phreatobacter stygius]|uniref:ABC transporter ATP-binding protein n=1 Tax=Phreatobacter stygius TaxID=1940610 RepID=A0A4D7BB43_9HYPH|nr:ABC transporter ATP-binding protein [Phreatobacter stygius]QCI67873.1 ABC transporter ATP-binding protein [Phreatobacter stygius]